MRSRLLGALCGIALCFAVPGAAQAGSLRDCGHAGTNARDVRASGISCTKAKPVARAWVRSDCESVFDTCDAGTFSCVGRRAGRHTRTHGFFKMRCTDRGRLVVFYVPYQYAE